jgi:hypothetical protein
MSTILINPGSVSAIEEAKHEQHQTLKTLGGLKPGNPYVYRPYPAMLYKADHLPGSGKWATAMAPPRNFGFQSSDDWDRACQEAAQFTKNCQLIVNDATAHKKAREEGWRDTPDEAMEFRAKLDKIIGDAAAERNWEDRRMTDKAKAESDQIQADTFGHMPEIPAQPIKRRGGRPKGSKNKPKDDTAA